MWLEVITWYLWELILPTTSPCRPPPLSTEWWDFLTPILFLPESGGHPHRPGSIFWRNRPSQCWQHTSKEGVPGVPVRSPEGAPGHPEKEAHWPSAPAAALQGHRGRGSLDPRDRALSGFHLPWWVLEHEQAELGQRTRRADCLRDLGSLCRICSQLALLTLRKTFSSPL